MVKLLLVSGVMLGSITGLSADAQNKPAKQEIKSAVTVQAEDVVSIVGPIQDLKGQAEKLINAVRDNKKSVTIVINSPGGRVDTTIRFIETMDKVTRAGVQTYCIVNGIAASAAAVIFGHCQRREATFGSAVLFHSAAVMGVFRLNMQSALQLAQQLALTNQLLWAETMEHFDEGFFLEAFMSERFVDVSEAQENSLTYLTVIRKLNILAPKINPSK